MSNDFGLWTQDSGPERSDVKAKARDNKPIDRHLFIRVMGSFATGVTVVTVTSKSGEHRGFTASAVSSLSLEPRLLLVCLSERSTTLDIIKETGAFGLNILASNQQEIAQQFATRADDRFKGVRWRPGA